MKSLIISIFLLFVLVVTPKHAFTEPLPGFSHIEVADVFYAPMFNDTGLFGAFGGYFGGDSSNQIIDWSIGNTIPHSGSMTDDIVFSTSVGNFMNPANWFERMRITKDGNVSIGMSSSGEKLTVAGTIESTSGGVKFPDGTVQTSASGVSGLLTTSGGGNFGMIRYSGGDQENAGQIPIPRDGRLLSLAVQTYVNTLDADAEVTLRLNGVDTALKITVPASSTSVQITTANINMSASDLVSLELDTTAAGTGTMSYNATYEFKLE